MSTITDSVQYTLEEKIVPTIFESLWELDPVYPMIRRSSSKVVKNRGIGRGWSVLKTWVTGVSGGAKFQSAQGGDVLSGPQNFTMYDTPQGFQAVDEVTAPAMIQTTVTLIEHRGNFYLPHQILRADRLNASIGSVVAQNLKGVSDLLAQQESAVFYSSSSTTGELADIGDTSANVTNKTSPTSDTSVMIFDLSGTNASGRVHRLRPGMLVDLYDSTGTTKRNSNYTLAVDNVDPLNNTVHIRRVDGNTFQTSTTLNGGVTYAGAGGDDDIIVIKDSVNVAPKGLESWIADGSTVTSFFGIDVRNYSQFKSYVPSAISAALTENVLNKHFAQFYEAFPGKRLDTAITTMGVLIGFIDNIDSNVQGNLMAATDHKGVYTGRYMYERNGRPVAVEAGWDSFRYRFASRSVDIYTSTYCNSGTFYAGRMQNGGLTRYVPPALPGARQDPRIGNEVEFIASIGGSGGMAGIFKHAHGTTGATTDFVEAPFVRQWNVMPAQPNWMKMTGITEVLG
jgi:hypothetical protein